VTTKKQKSFNEWFVYRYGERPSDKPLEELMNDYMMAKIEAHRKEQLFHECKLYDVGLAVASVTLRAQKRNLFRSN